VKVYINELVNRNLPDRQPPLVFVVVIFGLTYDTEPITRPARPFTPPDAADFPADH
jgi:hypothetical protein